MKSAGVLLETGTAYPSRAPEFTPGFFLGRGGEVRLAHFFKKFLCCPIMCLISVLWCS